ncbi:FMN reductase [Friedmanniella endophytica]|uniref:FMN reductase n=1 Tax=Microlunatus kandeliicorticis TaxID=1759536 RepID=A0A7W3P6W5_9ACTN|nr:FMN reductase [Microlunatus kandeliicorticis]MBA8795404.1 FMN reductase [Microlunatus kandeliicorticis]
MTRQIAVITAGLSEPSSTRLLADRLADATRTALAVRGEQVEVDVVELRPLAHAAVDATLTGFTSGPLTEALDTVARADGVIAVTPTFQASYSGLFKSFLDVFTIDHADALRGTPVLLGATAGTARHSLVLESAMRPLFSYLGALTVPTAVFAASEDWGAAGQADRTAGELASRIDRAAGELAGLVTGRPVRATTEDDGFGEVVDFATLLSR